MTREEIYSTVQSTLKNKVLFAASEFLYGLSEALEIVEVFENLIPDCYWKARSTEQVIHFANAGIHHCLAQASTDEDIDDDSARELRFAAKRMATNAASFTWIGWEEPGVAISADQMRRGFAFARYSVRQLHELDPTDAQLAFTYWFLAAHLMVCESYDEALSVFTEARNHSDSDGGNPDELTMLKGYIGLTKILSGDNEVGESEFGSSVATLKSRDGEDAAFYATQLVDVRAFFEKRKNKG